LNVAGAELSGRLSENEVANPILLAAGNLIRGSDPQLKVLVGTIEDAHQIDAFDPRAWLPRSEPP
jgi:hypothetical protein